MSDLAQILYVMNPGACYLYADSHFYHSHKEGLDQVCVCEIYYTRK